MGFIFFILSIVLSLGFVSISEGVSDKYELSNSFVAIFISLLGLCLALVITLAFGG